MYIAVLHLLYPSLDGGRWVIAVFATMGRGTKRVENHWPRRFSQDNE